LITPLSTKEILVGKWLGSVLCARLGWLWLGSLWGLGLVTGVLQPVAAVYMAASWLVYGAFFSSLGLFFSVWARSSMRAMLGSILATLFFLGGYWVVLWSCFLPFAFMGSFDFGFEYVMEFFGIALTPPASFVWPVTGINDSLRHDRYIIFAMVGLVIWLVAAFLCFNAAWARFSRQYRQRVHIPRPVPPWKLPKTVAGQEATPG
jgi:ABC-type transport system involved in multi-copper enzyme maturation permease subunit